MKILLTHAYTKENKGDAAIISVLLEQLNHAFPGSTITVSINDDDTRYKGFEHCRVMSNSMYLSIYRFHSLPFKLLYTLYIESAFLLWALLYRSFSCSIRAFLPKSTHGLACEYLESDLFVPVGGGYLTAKKGLLESINLLLLLNPILVGILLRKPIILYTQSIGPFATTFQGWITKVVLNKTQRIFVREDHTLATLKKIGVKADLVIRTADAGFLFDANKEVRLTDFLENIEALNAKMLVGITVRQWLDQAGQYNFEKAIALFIDRITREQNIYFIFIPQVTSTIHHDDDRIVAKRIVRLMANKRHVMNCTDTYDHYELKKLYSHLHFLIGTRFHSVIFSLTSYVPALAIEYEYKTSGIMKDLGLSEWVIPIEQVTADILYEKFSQLLSAGDIYKQKLQHVLPDYILRAKAVEKQMVEAYARTTGQ
jgi:colanic acid/amylovoran biosynthesis protein